MNKTLNPNNPDSNIVAYVKQTFGDDTNYSVKAWPSPFERDQGFSVYLEDNISLDEAMSIFAKAILNNSSVEVVYIDNDKEIAICIGGRDADVNIPEWVY